MDEKVSTLEEKLNLLDKKIDQLDKKADQLVNLLISHEFAQKTALNSINELHKKIQKDVPVSVPISSFEEKKPEPIVQQDLVAKLNTVIEEESDFPEAKIEKKTSLNKMAVKQRIVDQTGTKVPMAKVVISDSNRVMLFQGRTKVNSGIWEAILPLGTHNIMVSKKVGDKELLVQSNIIVDGKNETLTDLILK